MFKTIYLNNILVFFTKLRTFEEHFCSSVSISRCNRSYDIFKEMNPVKLKKKINFYFQLGLCKSVNTTTRKNKKNGRQEIIGDNLLKDSKHILEHLEGLFNTNCIIPSIIMPYQATKNLLIIFPHSDFLFSPLLITHLFLLIFYFFKAKNYYHLLNLLTSFHFTIIALFWYLAYFPHSFFTFYECILWGFSCSSKAHHSISFISLAQQHLLLLMIFQCSGR